MFFALALALKVIIKGQGSVEKGCCSSKKVVEDYGKIVLSETGDCSGCTEGKIEKNCSSCGQ